jgi:anti-sigma factor ChrR (cupin superfamily)
MADDGGWEPTATPGVEARQLFLDTAARRVTMMVRMAAGSSYPAHRHGGAEECFVVSGDLRTGDVHMHAGDWQRADKGSRHPDQTTDGGCVLLLISSLDDTLDA